MRVVIDLKVYLKLNEKKVYSISIHVWNLIVTMYSIHILSANIIKYV